MQHVEQSEYYSDTDVDEAFEDRVGAIGDGKQEGRGRLGIALSFSLVVMMILFLLGTPHTPHTPHTHRTHTAHTPHTHHTHTAHTAPGQ